MAELDESTTNELLPILNFSFCSDVQTKSNVNVVSKSHESRVRARNAVERRRSMLLRTSNLIDNLGPSQKSCLKSTWRSICGRNSGMPTTKMIFDKIIQNQSVVREIFYKAAFLTIFTNQAHITTQTDHARLLAFLFKETIENIDGPTDCLMERYSSIGRHHAFLKASGFSAEIWEHFGEQAVEVFTMQDLVKVNPDAPKSWAAVIACMTDQMRHGFEVQCRALRRSRAEEERRNSQHQLSDSIESKFLLGHHLSQTLKRARSSDTMRNSKKNDDTDNVSRKNPDLGSPCSRPTTLNTGVLTRRRTKSTNVPGFSVDSGNLNLDSLLDTNKNHCPPFARFGDNLKVGISPSAPPSGSGFEENKTTQVDSNFKLKGLQYFNDKNFPKSSCVHCGNPVTCADDLKITYSSASYLGKVLAEELKLDSLTDFNFKKTSDQKIRPLVVPEIIVHLAANEESDK